MLFLSLQNVKTPNFDRVLRNGLRIEDQTISTYALPLQTFRAIKKRLPTLHKGPSIKDVRSKLGLYDPLNFGLTPLPLPRMSFMDVP